MRALVLCVFAGWTCGIGSARTEPVPPQAGAWSADLQAVANANNRFAFDLYAGLRAGSGNLFFSPYSIHAALAMTADGANGVTRDEMIRVLHLPNDRAKALAAGDLGRLYARPGRPYELAVANALWGQKGIPWRPGAAARLVNRFGANLNDADFASDPEAARRRINAWAADRTRGKVQTVLGPGDVTPLTRLVLANAIYFKSDWDTKFNKAATADAPFHLADGERAMTPLMHQESEFRYAEGDGYQVLELSYKGGDLGMDIVLPRKPDGLPAIEKQVSADVLAKWLAAGRDRPVRVWLPRFRIEAASSPADALRGLGMKAAFDPQAADFSGLVGERLSLTRVAHRAFVEVTEEGTVAAAVSGIGGNLPAPVPPPPVDFRADRPFLFLIRDLKHGTILFLGRLTNPKG
ncbi:MAG TPA: serpin family protein [Gemmataceae bacterium]|nr:serpin family protein [Gemmataceae bacterium]